MNEINVNDLINNKLDLTLYHLTNIHLYVDLGKFENATYHINSLENILNLNSKEKIEQICMLILKYHRGYILEEKNDYIKSAKIFNDLTILSIKWKFPFFEGISVIHSIWALYKYSKIDKDKIILLGNNVEEIANSIKSTYLKCLVYNILGVYFRTIGEVRRALQSYKSALFLLIEPYAFRLRQSITMNIGVVNSDIGEYENALKYYKLTNNILEVYINRYSILGKLELNYGNLYFRQRNFNEAIAKYEKGYIIFRDKKNIFFSSWALYYLIRTYLETGNLNKAKDYLDILIELNEKFDNPIQIQLTKLSRINILKNSDRILDKGIALQLCEEVINEGNYYHEITSSTLNIACQLLLLEITKTGNMGALTQLKKLIIEFENLSSIIGSKILEFQVKYYIGIIAMLEEDYDSAMKLMFESKNMITNLGYKTCIAKINRINEILFSESLKYVDKPINIEQHYNLIKKISLVLSSNKKYISYTQEYLLYIYRNDNILLKFKNIKNNKLTNMIEELINDNKSNFINEIQKTVTEYFPYSIVTLNNLFGSKILLISTENMNVKYILSIIDKLFIKISSKLKLSVQEIIEQYDEIIRMMFDDLFTLGLNIDMVLHPHYNLKNYHVQSSEIKYIISRLRYSSNSNYEINSIFDNLTLINKIFHGFHEIDDEKDISKINKNNYIKFLKNFKAIDILILQEIKINPDINSNEITNRIEDIPKTTIYRKIKKMVEMDFISYSSSNTLLSDNRVKFLELSDHGQRLIKIFGDQII